MSRKEEFLCNMTIAGFILGVAIVCGTIPTSDDLHVRVALGVGATMAWLWLVPNALRDDFDWLVGILPIIFFFIVEKKMEFFLKGFANPFIALFLGGLLIIPALEANRIDLLIRWLIDRLRLGAIGTMVFVGGCAAFVSMFLSNTISATLFIPIADSAVRPFGSSTLWVRTRLVVAWAVTIGGTATIIGTPPNAITVKALAEVGIRISAMEWTRVALPIAFVLFGVMIVLVCFGGKLSTVKRADTSRVSWKDVQPYLPRLCATLFVFSGFVATWIVFEQDAHKAKQSYFWGTVPVAALFMLMPVWRRKYDRRRKGLLVPRDILNANFGIRCLTVLVLAGGLALGEGMKMTRTDVWVAHQMIPYLKPIALTSLVLFRLSLAYPSVFFGEFVSNTALCALLMPILLTMAPLVGEDPEKLGRTMGIECSLGFMLLMATPPNFLCLLGLPPHAEGAEYKRLLRQRGLIFDVISVPIVVFMI